MENIAEIFYEVIKGKAVHDYHNNEVFNGYEPGSREYFTYQEKIEELKEQDDGSLYVR